MRFKPAGNVSDALSRSRDYQVREKYRNKLAQPFCGNHAQKYPPPSFASCEAM
jgi:hypothetical protein